MHVIPVELLILLLAALLDLILAEPPNLSHPVVWFGEIIGFFDSWWKRRGLLDVVAGAFFTVAVMVFAFIISRIPSLLSFFQPFYVIASVYLLFSCISIRSMVDHAKATVSNGINAEKVQMIVSRDTSKLNEHQLCSAVIESVAENFVDGVLAPLLYFSLFGLSGVVIYRAINVCDAMIGYRTPRHERFGKFAAKVDDVANFVPARLSVLLFALLNPKALKAYKHNIKFNGHAIVAMAHVLGVTLEKPGYYKVNAGKPPDKEDIKCAISIYWKLSLISIVIAAVVLSL